MRLYVLLVAIMLAAWGLMSPATAFGAPALTLPPAPPGQFSCASGWQTGGRVQGVDDGVGYLIESDFDLARSAGRVLRRSIRSIADGADGGKGGSLVIDAPRWDAGAILDGGAPAPDARRIFTAGADGRTVPLSWSQLDAGQRILLDPKNDGLGEVRIDYLRGKRQLEGGALRQRSTLLGGIVRSRPLLVGPPRSDQQGADFATFYTQFRSRQKLVYVGANDGMLHAFDWNSGTEIYAYLPAAMLHAVRDYADSARADTPMALLDGSPAEGEAQLGRQWRSVLVSGMGMGARGMFALDVTDPAAGPTLLWEFTDEVDGAIGYVHAPPQIVKLARNAADGASTYRYFAVISSGINPKEGGADGALFLLALDKPAGAPWRLGENYYRIRAPARDPAAVNALAPIVVALAADGSAQTAYAGDLQGAMWRFDLARLSAGDSGTASSSAHLLFVARASDDAPQAITQAARVAHAPGGGYLVLFGTGKTLEAGDLDAATFVQQSFYAVRDGNGAGRPAMAVPGRAALAERRLIPATSGGASAFVVNGSHFDYNGGGAGIRQGWYVDFPLASADGERNAAPPELNGGAVLITTLAPGSQPCAPVVRAYLVDTLTGLALDRRGSANPGNQTGRAVNGSDGNLPLLQVRAGEKGTVTPTGNARLQHNFTLYQLPASGTGAVQVLDSTVVTTNVGRLSWREIANWRELHAKAAKPPPSSP